MTNAELDQDTAPPISHRGYMIFRIFNLKPVFEIRLRW